MLTARRALITGLSESGITEESAETLLKVSSCSTGRPCCSLRVAARPGTCEQPPLMYILSILVLSPEAWKEMNERLTLVESSSMT